MGTDPLRPGCGDRVAVFAPGAVGARARGVLGKGSPASPALAGDADLVLVIGTGVGG